MNVDDIVWRLAQLASLPFQERYVIGGTADEYVLAEEILENVDGLKFLTRRPGNEPTLTDVQKDALDSLFACVETHSGEALSARSGNQAAILIRESEIWNMLREKAALALMSFGLSADMSVEEIDKLSE
jgi:hypothetical protein